jgi:putative PIN family toxin of toxin-antitoxin system
MRVMLDTNIIISAMVFKSAKMSEVLKKATDSYELCLAAYTIEETKRILFEKFPSAETSVEVFFDDYPYTLIDAPVGNEKPLAHIRDTNDYPILYAAITGQIDILVTGDKDFFDIKVERPEIMMPLDFLARC